jgi:hypothetical protein
MPQRLRNLVALAVGIVVGGAVNMAIITLGAALIPPPAGVDPGDVESLSRSIHLFAPRHFVMPLLAHAAGTLVGAFVAHRIAVTYRRAIPLAVGGFFLFGGIAASIMIPAPAWFIALDLLVAYIPMAWLGIRLGRALDRGSDRMEAAELDVPVA